MKVIVIYPADDQKPEFRHETESNEPLFTPLLEDIFRRFNCVDGNEECVQLGVRSMSVGDVVYLPGIDRWFIVDGCGWYEASEEFVKEWRKKPITERFLGPTWKKAS